MTSFSITDRRQINTLQDIARGAEKRGSIVPNLPRKSRSLKLELDSGEKYFVAIESQGRPAYFVNGTLHIPVECRSEESELHVRWPRRGRAYPLPATATRGLEFEIRALAD